MAVAGGGWHSLGLKADGSIVAWGDNGSGQCNVPAPNSGFVAVAGGGWHSLGLRGVSVAVGEERVRRPAPLSLTVAPNPFRSRTTVEYALAERTMARLAIYDVSGRRVRILDAGDRDAGQRHVQWDGRSDLGERVAAGVYLIRLESGAETRVGRVVLVP